jgi:hypothetical protein
VLRQKLIDIYKKLQYLSSGFKTIAKEATSKKEDGFVLVPGHATVLSLNPIINVK